MKSIDEYPSLALLTENRDHRVVVERILGQGLMDPLGNPHIEASNLRLAHAAVGLVTEIGELFEFEKEVQKDYTNLREELGDCYWYAALVCDVLKIPFSALFQMEVDPAELAYTPMYALDNALTSAANLLDLVFKKRIMYGKVVEDEKILTALRASLYHLQIYSEKRGEGSSAPNPGGQPAQAPGQVQGPIQIFSIHRGRSL